MTTTRYTNGETTITVSEDIAGWLREATSRALLPGMLDAMEQEATEQEREAAGAWYQNVRRRTGKTGRMDVVTTVSDTEVRVSVGSTAPQSIYVHRPGAYPTGVEEINEATYYRLKREVSPSAAFHARRGDPSRGIEIGKYYRVLPLKPSDGKYLVPELIRKPFQARKARLVELMKAGLARRMGE